MKNKTMYLVMRIQTEIQTNIMPISVVDGEHLGMLSVYASKKSAQKVWGKNIELQEVRIKQ